MGAHADVSSLASGSPLLEPRGMHDDSDGEEPGRGQGALLDLGYDD